jgi:CRISPR-associated protein Cas5d
MFFADDCRAQRNTLALRDVDYIVEASIGMTECAGFGDSWTKFAAMFQRRLGTGQHLFQPYLGCREFPAFVEPSREVEDTIKETRELGWMLYDLDYDRDRTPLFFQARLEDGVLRLPTLEVMRK